jgi:hypothetical protein
LYSFLFYHTGLIKIGQKVGYLLKLFPILVNRRGYRVYDYTEYQEICKLDASRKKNGDDKIIVSNVTKEALFNGQYTSTGQYNYIKNSFYDNFKIPKNRAKGKDRSQLKREDFRVLNSPKGILKEFQKAIQVSIFNKFKFPDYITGFTKEGGLYPDALMHSATQWSCRIDIKDYFGSIKFFHVRNSFMFLGYDQDTASIIAELCTFRGYLPQGAATSPFLSNLIGYLYFDRAVKEIATHFGLRYSRYADDLFFSDTKKREPELKGRLIKAVAVILNNAGFRVNYEKSHRIGKYTHHKRMGQITIHNDIPKISNKKFVDKVRINIHRIRSMSIKDILQKIKKENGKYMTFDRFVKKLRGMISYIYMIYPERGKSLFENLYKALEERGFYELVPKSSSFRRNESEAKEKVDERDTG